MKTMLSEIGLPNFDKRCISQPKNPINKTAMNNRLLIAAVFHFVHPVEKDNYFSCQSKQLSRCCINFPHELTCQILTNQSIKIGHRAWPMLDHGKKRSSPPVFVKNWLNFRVWGQFEIKILIVRGHNDINTRYLIWIIGKNKIEPAIIRNW